jgi:hypothetical protein
MQPGILDLTLYHGDNNAMRLFLFEDDEQTIPSDLAGSYVNSEIRNRPGGSNWVAFDCTLTLPNQIDVAVTPAHFQDPMFPEGHGSYDVQITTPDGHVHTVLKGDMTIEPDVTDTHVP